jgi:hypothetical protein
MNKMPYSLAAIAFLFILMGAACSAPAQSPTAAAGVPTLAAGPTSAAVATIPPIVQATSAGGEVSQAPICQASSSCAALNAEQTPLQCVKKVPYTNVRVPKGTTFEVLDKSGQFTCTDSGVVQNGQEVLTCHGKELYSFQLRLSNASCGGATLTTGTGQCQDGYGYDDSQKCCAPVSGGSSGVTTVTVNLGACPLPKP